MTGTDPPSLLVIDDDADIRDLVTAMFEHHGFQVDALADGIDALRLKKHYDVILLDLNMPVFDGERLTDYWSVTDPAILDQVIVLSGYTRAKQGRAVAAFATVRKPIDLPHLLNVVTRCLATTASGQVSRN
jgi:CheY-like chemotaxis protein